MAKRKAKTTRRKPAAKPAAKPAKKSPRKKATTRKASKKRKPKPAPAPTHLDDVVEEALADRLQGAAQRLAQLTPDLEDAGVPAAQSGDLLNRIGPRTLGEDDINAMLREEDFWSDVVSNPAQRAFLAAYCALGVISAAAAVAGIARSTVYWWLERDEAFREGWKRAQSLCAHLLEDLARERAVLGWKQEVFHKGRPCGTRTMIDNALLMFLLKAVKPAKYRERIDHRVTDPSAEHRKLVIVAPDVLADIVEHGAAKEAVVKKGKGRGQGH